MGFFSTIASSLQTTGSDFFGGIKGGANEFLGQLSTEILPNWTKQQLEEQAKDLLNKDTYNNSAAPPRVEQSTANQPLAFKPIASTSPALWDSNTTENYYAPANKQSDAVGKYLAVGIGLVLLVIVFKSV